MGKQLCSVADSALTLDGKQHLDFRAGGGGPVDVDLVETCRGGTGRENGICVSKRRKACHMDWIKHQLTSEDEEMGSNTMEPISTVRGVQHHPTGMGKPFASNTGGAESFCRPLRQKFLPAPVEHDTQHVSRHKHSEGHSRTWCPHHGLR